MQKNIVFELLTATLMSLMLTACGGGGGGSALDNALNGSSGSSSSAIGADTLQNIEFKDAIPGVINLKGTGGAESSLVRFRTVGKTGSPIQGIKVNFALTSEVGGLSLSQNSAVSDKDGYVSTSVTSGNISTSIRVTATVKDDPSISTQSNLLVIATGLPDQKSMSIALEKFNPAGWNYNGVTSKVSILLADAYNNPVADGTAVYFTTEGGSIKSSCTTVNGACDVSWTSQDPRPQRTSADNSIGRILCLDVSDQHTCEAERAGRSTILATAIGNESFTDTNGNGIFDPGVDTFVSDIDYSDTNNNQVYDSGSDIAYIDVNGNGLYDNTVDVLLSATDFIDNNGNGVFDRGSDVLKNSKCARNVPFSSYESPRTIACDDLSEAYLDSNENGVHDTGEFFINFITDTSLDDKSKNDHYSPNNGLYNGAFCQPDDETNGKCSRSPVTIRKQHMVIMSCDSPLLDDNNALPALPASYLPYTHAVADCNGNALPEGTKITVGANPAITVGNQYDWTPIIASPGESVKLTISIGTSSTKEITVAAGN